MTTTPRDAERDTPSPSTPVHPETGVTLTTQTPLDPEIAVDVTDAPTVTPLWNAISSHPQIKALLIRGIRNATHGKHPAAIHELCDTLLPDDLHTTIPFLVRGIASGDGGAVRTLWEIVDGIGSGSTPTAYLDAIIPWYHFAVDAEDTPRHTGDDVETVPPPTITISLSYESFSQRRRDERTDICQLITTLGNVFDVRVVGSRYTLAWLTNTHRDTLPCVSSWRDTTHEKERVEETLAEIDPDSTHVKILGEISDTPDNTISYTQLFGTLPVGKSRVKQCLSTLSELKAVNKVGPPNDKRVVITSIGIEALETIQTEYGTQSTLDDVSAGVSDPPKNSPQRRDPGNSDRGVCRSETDTKQHNTPQTAQQSAPFFKTEYLTQASHDGIVGCGASEADVAVLKTDPTPWEPKDRMVSYDSDRREAVVSTHATNPLDYTVSHAVALASPMLLDEVVDDGVFDTLVNDIPEPIVHLSRQIGWVTEETLSSAEAIRDLFVEVGESIERLTKQLKHDTYTDSRDEHVKKILQKSHGLAGSIVHALDTGGVDVIRDIRVPAGLTTEQVANLALSLSYTVTIQSAYKHHSVYRQLIEQREKKRDLMFTVDVDPADNIGSLIGSVVLRGGSAPQLGAKLTDIVADTPTHDDAPEIATPIRVGGVGRKATAVAVTRTLRRRRFRPTRSLTTVINGVCNDPLTAANTLARLQRDDIDGDPAWRRVRWDELRSVLTTVDVDQLVPRLPNTVGRILSTLLRADDPTLSQSELAERVGVTTQTLRNQRENLETTGLIQITDAGQGRATEWRVALPTYTEAKTWDSETASTATRYRTEHGGSKGRSTDPDDETLPIPTPPTRGAITHDGVETDEQGGEETERFGGVVGTAPTTVDGDPNETRQRSVPITTQPWIGLYIRLRGGSTQYTSTEVTVAKQTDTNQTTLTHPETMFLHTRGEGVDASKETPQPKSEATLTTSEDTQDESNEIDTPTEKDLDFSGIMIPGASGSEPEPESK